MIATLPPLVSKALADTGYDVVASAGQGWFAASISGESGRVLVKDAVEGVLLALPDFAMASRVGLAPVVQQVPANMGSIGLARSPAETFEALRLLHVLQTHPEAKLSSKVEARLADIPETERTREVRQRIGQDVFREALLELWQGRCAVTGLALPPELLRASHAKPWAVANDAERLDPFNGLLLAAHLDAMFDTGLITFNEKGRLVCSSTVDASVKAHFKISGELHLRKIAPGHVPYLRWHAEHVFRR